MKNYLFAASITLSGLMSASVEADIITWNVTASDGVASTPAGTTATSATLDMGVGGRMITATQDLAGAGGDNFTLSYDVGAFNAVIWTFSGLTFSGGQTLDSVTTTGTGTASLIGLDTFTFTTDADTAGFSETITVNLAGGGGGGAAVPEPSSFAALALIGLGGVWVRRRQQTKA